MLGSLPLAPGATAAPAQSSAPGAVVAPAVVDPEPGFATKQTPMLAIAADGLTTVKAKDKYMIITLKKADAGEYTAGNKTYRIRGTGNLASEWNDFGQDKRGALLGRTKRGKPMRLWVRWGPMKAASDGTLTVTAYPKSGKVDSLVRNKAKYPLYSANKSVAKKAKLNVATVVAAADNSEKWHFTGYGQTGKVRQQGSSFFIDFNDVTPKLPGVQPSGRAALIRTSWLSQSFNEVMRKYGAKARLVLAGQGKDGSDIAEVFFPRSLVLKGDTLSVRATQGSKFSRRLLAAMSSIKDPSFLLDVSNPGKVDSMVLVTGDSIASGEGASMGGTYLNGNLALDDKPQQQNLKITKGGIQVDQKQEIDVPLLGKRKFTAFVDAAVYAEDNLTIPIPVSDETQVKRWKLFCETVDLACTSAEVKNGKLVYKRDPGIVYEKGTWEKTTLDRFGFSCHRSKTAPGTWLARYWKEVRGLPVRGINLACSGATTDSILDKSYLGQRPQSEQVKAIADWVPVTHIVNTIGANDIKFSTVARDCVFAPINSLLPVFLGGGSGSIVDLLFPTNGDPTPLVLLADDVKRDANGKVVSANTFFSPGVTLQNGNKLQGELCSDKDGKDATEAIKTLPQKIKQVIEALHKAAPDAKIVNSNYPNEVPNSANTYFPRQQWWDATRDTWLTGGEIGLQTNSGTAAVKEPLTGIEARPFTTLNGALNQADALGNPVLSPGWRAWMIEGGGANCSGTKGKNLSAASPPLSPICPDDAGKYPEFTDGKIDGKTFFDYASDPANPNYATAQKLSENLFNFGEIQAGISTADLWYAFSLCVTDPLGSILGAKVCPLPPGRTATLPDPSKVPPQCKFPSQPASDPGPYCNWLPGDQAQAAPLSKPSLANTTQKSWRYAQWWLKFLTQGGILDVLGLGAIMYGLDQDWANETIIEGLNEAVDDGVELADPKGEYTFIVDQTQTFNGRELGGKWVGADENPLFTVWGYDGTKNPGAYPANKVEARGPGQSRAQFVNNFLVGQKLPIVCPSNAVLDGENGCIGSDQEALHPNWMGQAAQGQCIVAVVTQAFGAGGNACVRSVGDGKAKGEEYTAANIEAKTQNGTGALLFSEVNGRDKLCLKPFAPVREDAKKGVYTPCDGGFDPMPTWSDDWDNGRVKWQGNKLHWG